MTANTTPVAGADINIIPKKKKKKSMFRVVMKRLVRKPVAMIGLGILVILILIAILAPLIAPYSPTAMDYSNILKGPSSTHLLGCDQVGRDILSRLMHGARYSLSLGFIASIVNMILGMYFGAIIGYASGKTDMIVMRFMDIWSSIPPMLLAILIATALGAGFVNTIIAMTIGGIPGAIRGTRAMALKEREMEYLEAARSINCSQFKILFKHMTPNIIYPAIIGFTMGIGGTIMGAAGLAYIGLGVQPPAPEWGTMLAEGKSYILTHPHMITFPGIAIAITVLSINMFGDGLRDALDPRLKR